MKTAVCLSAIVACLTLFAQEAPRPATGGLAERFKQLDRNGEGKLAVEELGSEWLRKLDANGDGFATLEEATGSFRDDTLVYRRLDGVPPADSAQRSAQGRTAGADATPAWLSKPSLEVCLSAGSAEEATKFFAEDIGLAPRGEPRGGATGAALRMLLFGAGSSNVKVRVYQQPPAKLPAEIAARNGLRVLTIPVEGPGDAVARLKRLGYEDAEVEETRGMRWALARNADGTAFELVEAQAGTARLLEIGLVVPDLAKAREFFTGVYGAKELPETTSRVLVCGTGAWRSQPREQSVDRLAIRPARMPQHSSLAVSRRSRPLLVLLRLRPNRRPRRRCDRPSGVDLQGNVTSRRQHIPVNPSNHPGETMNAHNRQLTRREFLDHAARVTAAVTAAAAIGSAAAPLVARAGEADRPRASRISYYYNGEIHVNEIGKSEGKPLTTGHTDFKPSWSKTGDMLVCFRRTKNDPVVTNWLSAIFVIHVDGTGFHQLSDGTHTDFNPTWTRDGKNTPVWNRRNPATGGFCIMASKVGAKPGEEVTLTDKRYSSWVHSAVTDGRLFVASAPPGLGRGYYLMTPNLGGEPQFERIECELATKGLLDRVSVSPSETKLCFEYQKGFKHSMGGRTLYIADFDLQKRTITNPKPIANEAGKPFWIAYPRCIDGEAAVIYHSGETGKNQLYVYRLEAGSTSPSAATSVATRQDHRPGQRRGGSYGRHGEPHAAGPPARLQFAASDHSRPEPSLRPAGPDRGRPDVSFECRDGLRHQTRQSLELGDRAAAARSPRRSPGQRHPRSHRAGLLSGYAKMRGCCGQEPHGPGPGQEHRAWYSLHLQDVCVVPASSYY